MTVMVIISCILLGLMIGFIVGGHWAIDSCTEYFEDSVYLNHIKECIFNDEISDKDKVFIIKRQLKSIQTHQS